MRHNYESHRHKKFCVFLGQINKCGTKKNRQKKKYRCTLLPQNKVISNALILGVRGASPDDRNVYNHGWQPRQWRRVRFVKPPSTRTLCTSGVRIPGDTTCSTLFCGDPTRATGPLGDGERDRANERKGTSKVGLRPSTHC